MVYIQAKELYGVHFAKYMTPVNSANVLRVYFQKIRGPRCNFGAAAVVKALAGWASLLVAPRVGRWPACR